MAETILQVEHFTYTELHKMKIKEINCETGEEVVRDATAEEIAQAEKDKAKVLVEQQAAAEAVAKRQALFAKLGITEEEAKLLLS